MQKIVKLRLEIQKRISAGEVIVSPYNVLKELLENSVDADSSTIRVLVSKDNLNIEIHDNGFGIEEDDFNFLALPHHTSKYETLSFGEKSFGFRGEALSSIRCVSNLIIKSKVKSSDIGYIKNFKTDEFSPISMNDGTSIFIKNLFYNNKLRETHFYKKLKVHKSMNELVNFFSIKNPQIKFTFNEISFLSNENITRDVQLQSENFYEDLLNFKKSFIFPDKKSLDDDFKTSFKCKQIKNIYNMSVLRHFANDFITIIFTPTSINFAVFNFILFINNRLVCNSNIKSCIYKKYANALPKGRFPFIYLELRIPTKHVDVNVHPSKKEILIEFEDTIIEIIDMILDLGLNEIKEINKENITNVFLKDSELIYKSSSTLEDCIQKVKTQEYKLLSIQKLKNNIKEVDKDFFKDIVYVGIANLPDITLLIQYNQYLMKCDLKKLMPIFIYQYFLYNFGNYKSVACCIESKFTNENFLEMLKDYFSIEIENKKILRVPVIGEYSGDEKEWENFDIKSSTEEKVFEEIFFQFMKIYKNVEMNKQIFSIIKKNVKSTKEVLETFTIVKCLKDLYKNFERC